MYEDISPEQRFSNFRKAYVQLSNFFLPESLNKLEAQGLIQAFEYTFELAGNVMKD